MNNIDNEYINAAVSDLSTVICESVIAGGMYPTTTSTSSDNSIQQPEWWDNDCELLKREKYKCLDRFRVSNTDLDFRAYIQSRNRFRNTKV